MAWIGRELRPPDMNSLTSLIERAPHAESVFLRAALARGDDYKGWWYGAWRDGQSLEAAMAVDNHQGSIYTANPEAAKGFAEQLLGMQKRLGASSQPHHHQLICEAKAMAIVWPIMRDLPDRKLIFDKECDLLQAAVDDTAASSSRVLLDLAQGADERVVYDFSAELRIEQLAFDPRKIGREAHVQRVLGLIAQGRALVAKEKDNSRPFFLGELTPLAGDTLLLSDAYVPPHYRTRGKLLSQVFWAAARHRATAGKQLIYLSADNLLTGAAKGAGWKRLTGYRWTVTLG